MPNAKKVLDAIKIDPGIVYKTLSLSHGQLPLEVNKVTIRRPGETSVNQQICRSQTFDTRVT